MNRISSFCIKLNKENEIDCLATQIGCACYARHTIFEFSLEQNVRIIEHSIFQRNDNELKIEEKKNENILNFGRW